MCNKIRLMGCVIMGIFLLLQASPVRDKLPEASAAPTAGISNGASSFVQESGRPMSDANPVRNSSLPNDSAISNGAKEETSNIQEKDSSKEKEVQYRTTPEIKGYTYNIKQLLEEIEQNLQKVDDEIKEAEIRKRNEEREAKVIEYFERGNAFYKEGKLKEAKKEWQRALEISKDPEMKDYIREAEKRAREEELARKKEEKERQRRLEAEQKEKERRLNEQAKVFYEEAISLYKSKNYEQAQVKFEQASQIVPHYLKTDYYLHRIPEDIQREKEQRLKEQAESIYGQAYSLYKDKQFNQALEKFKEVKSILPDYKKTGYYLNRIPKDIQKEKKRQELKRQRELKKQQEAEKRRQEKLEREREAKKELERKEQQRQLREKIQSLNKEGKNLYRNKNYDKAIAKFKEALKLDPENKYALKYLELIPKRIEEEKERLEREKQRQK